MPVSRMRLNFILPMQSITSQNENVTIKGQYVSLVISPLIKSTIHTSDTSLKIQLHGAAVVRQLEV